MPIAIEAVTRIDALFAIEREIAGKPSNNAAERSIRGIAVGRRNWTFCGSDTGGHRAAIMFSMIETAKLSDVDPKAWLSDVLARIADHPMQRLDELLPWNWKAAREAAMAA